MPSASQESTQVGRQALIAVLKRFAKHGKKDQPGYQLAWFQNKIANEFGYNNWALLHKHIAKMPEQQFDTFNKTVRNHPEIEFFVRDKAVKVIDVPSARDEMRRWVKLTYSPLIQFAFHDSESENGYSWPDVDIVYELQAEFGDKYPEELIEEVAGKLEAEEGPWGIESN